MSKRFDLEKALAGEPISFSGKKAYVIQSPVSDDCVIIETESFDIYKYSKKTIYLRDDVVMWQDEPQIDENGRYLRELPKGADIYYLDCVNRSFRVLSVFNYNPDDEYEKDVIKNKILFAKKESAEFEAIKRNIERYCNIENAKPVKYFGKVYSVPKWAKWMATDADDKVYTYESEPTLDFECFLANKGDCQLIGENPLVGGWQNSLREV
ncbi:hypothetical protein FHQ28_05370 [Pasteurellaceae bacterium USgator11]|nr:hypothetical protein FHQ19_09430 [Pasteurellaceae bacterium UScroc12]TNG94745.1 hypothetical protein FHQ20_08110 [Pasteurellaceae bacterium USgator41]TNG97716.1 hypothetical protein FHQ24_09900 [Pasteurellaceae bacterium UScroc31]TNH01677.1 hypothetical protein FHQ28_05370 [Pasteurellaceae bacterium USgator11]